MIARALLVIGLSAVVGCGAAAGSPSANVGTVEVRTSDRYPLKTTEDLTIDGWRYVGALEGLNNEILSETFELHGDQVMLVLGMVPTKGRQGILTAQILAGDEPMGSASASGEGKFSAMMPRIRAAHYSLYVDGQGGIWKVRIYERGE